MPKMCNYNYLLTVHFVCTVPHDSDLDAKYVSIFCSLLTECESKKEIKSIYASLTQERYLLLRRPARHLCFQPHVLLYKVDILRSQCLICLRTRICCMLHIIPLMNTVFMLYRQKHQISSSLIGGSIERW